MDSDNNPIPGAPPPTTDDPVLHVPSNGSNGNKSSSRASSIDVLNWSDFEDEPNNDENSQINSSLLKSIHSSSESASSSTSKLNVDHKDTLLEKTMTTSSLEEEEAESHKPEEPFEHLDDTGSVMRNRRRESAGDMIKSYASMASVASDVSSAPIDNMSNVPVLDDGPIWSKGEKHYRFEENRIINQKLTFCVLFSVVLAIGLGLGNLVAYNECEAEHRIIDQQACAKFDEKPTSQTVMPSKATATEPAIPLQNTKIPDMGVTQHQPQIPIEPTATAHKPNKPARKSKPMVDPEYKLHAQELSRVLKMLDELSRKIDQFENTTRQLGGIIMMRDEYVKPKSPKSKFVKLLDEIVHERGVGGKKKKNSEGDGHGDNADGTDLNAEAEKVLDKIAEAVLNVMNSNLLSKKESPTVDDEEETMLETSQGSHVYHPLDDSLFVARSDDDGKPNFVETDNRKILEELKPSTLSILQTHKFGEDSDVEFDYNGGDKRDRYSDVEDFGEFKEKHQKLQKKKAKRSKSKDANKPKKAKKEKSKNSERDDNKHKKKNGKNIIKDWQTDRAKLREENRDKIYPQQKRGKKFTNWQIERDFAREKFREKV